MIQNIALKLENSRIYERLPIVGAGYGDLEFKLQGANLVFSAPYFDECDSLEKLLVIKFIYVVDLILLNYETHPNIELLESDVIFVTDTIKFKNTKIKNFYFVFTSFESTFYVSAEHCEVTIENNIL